jgi:hypothetical protein
VCVFVFHLFLFSIYFLFCFCADGGDGCFDLADSDSLVKRSKNDGVNEYMEVIIYIYMYDII